MPIPEGYNTNYIIKNLNKRVIDYNRKHPNYVDNYKEYTRKRNHYLNKYRKISKGVNNIDFIDSVRTILDQYGMNARNSELVPKDVFRKTLMNSNNLLQAIEKEDPQIETLKPNSHILTLVEEIFNTFSRREALSYSGGFVIASKTLHFLFPELFVMIDGAHIGLNLYNVGDYHPHKADGKRWREIVPTFTGNTPNPSPRGAGRKSWDSARYCFALFYFKRLYLDWIESNNSTKEEFLSIDNNSNLITRILDKALW